jgi:outer membrane protein OmpA-like peptidoglycan-associated protein
MKKYIGLTIILIGLSVSLANAQWGRGLGYECKDKFVPASQQPGWGCEGSTAKWDDLKQTLQNAQVEQVGNEIKVTFSDKVFFATDSSTLNSSAQSEIQNLSNWLKNHSGRKVRVIGHTDSTGEAEYNQSLSQKRAEEVANAISNQGISKRHVHFIGQGETQPVSTNESEEGRQANRRVEIFIQN